MSPGAGDLSLVIEDGFSQILDHFLEGDDVALGSICADSAPVGGAAAVMGLLLC